MGDPSFGQAPGGPSRKLSFLATARDVQVAAGRSADRVDAVRSQGAQLTTIYGTTPFSAAGEGTYVVNFPVLFVEKPVFTAGLEFNAASSASVGSYPTWGATVNGWVYRTLGGVAYFHGATLVVRIVAASGAGFFVHHSFIGKAIRSPGFPA